LSRLFAPGCLTLSFQEGVRKPSATLYQRSLQAFRELGIEPGQILHVGSRLADDLAVAKRFGFRTALYAGDKGSLQATAAEVRDPELRPDRLLTDLEQIREILALA
jgi:FMN phosphatase YigB (HAD superfamily)